MKRIMWWKNRCSDFVWSQQLSVGNAILDAEHRNLIAKINNIMRLIKAGDTAALSDAFGLLETWLLAHFENERVFARTINFDFERHELAHQRLLNELRRLSADLMVGNRMIDNSKIKTYHRLLHDWLVRHITEDDMQMKPALQSCQYDYIPQGRNSRVVDVAGQTHFKNSGVLSGGMDPQAEGV